MNPCTTYADVLKPTQKQLAGIYDTALIAAGSLLIAVCTQIAIGWPVPVTGQTFAVLMLGALLGAKRGSLCVLVYLAQGAVGLPVFAHGNTGFTAFAGPTGGYLAGFVAAAYLVGTLAERGWDRKVAKTILAMCLGNLVIYFFGMIWLSFLIGFPKALTLGMYPFLPGDALKILLAAAILPTGWKLINMRK